MQDRQFSVFETLSMYSVEVFEKILCDKEIIFQQGIGRWSFYENGLLMQILAAPRTIRGFVLQNQLVPDKDVFVREHYLHVPHWSTASLLSMIPWTYYKGGFTSLQQLQWCSHISTSTLVQTTSQSSQGGIGAGAAGSLCPCSCRGEQLGSHGH